MGITIRTMTTVMGRSGKPERPSFFPIRAHLLTTCEAGGGIPPSGRAVRSARRIALSAESARQCRRTCGVGRHCLCGWQTAVASFASSLQIVVPALGQPATHLRQTCHSTRHALRVRQLYRRDGRCFPAPSIFFCLGKRNKTAPCRGQKESESSWRSITWKQRS